MKRVIVPAVLLAALLLRPVTAAADVPVIDPTGLVAQAKALLQDIKSYVLEIQSYTTQVQQYTTELQTLANMEVEVQSFIQHPSLGAAGALMGQLGINDPLSGLPSVYSLMSLTSGFSSNQGMQGIVSRIANLGGLVNSMSAVNGVYNCVDQSFACQQQQQVARANAGYQGVIAQIYSQLQSHLGITNALRTNLANSTDPAQRENIIAQLAAEQNWTTTAVGQLHATSALYLAQRQANGDRDNERMNQDIDALLSQVPKGG